MKLTRCACVLVLGSALLAPVACSSTPSDRNDAGEDGVAGGSTGGEGDDADGSSGPPPGLASCTIFPADNAWNRDVSGLPVHPLSDAYNVIAIDGENCKLYELYRGFSVGDGWQADAGVVWDLTKNDSHPAGCTSADAAGLPIFPGLVRYDEVVVKKEIRHAIRLTVSESQRAYVAPATHYASIDTNPNLPPMGLRLRMKADFDCSGFSDEASVVCTALERYGMIVADNGSDWYLSGAPDARWNDEALGDLKTIPGDAFEVVETGAELVTDSPDCSL